MANFQQLWHDTQFWASLRTTCIYAVVAVLLQNGLALLLALCLDTVGSLPGVGVLRTIFLIPGLISGITVGYVWDYIYAPNGGLLNTMLTAVHLQAWTHDWLGDPHTALGSIIVAALWQSVAFSMVVYVAGIQSVPPELLESARVDGASYLQRVRQILLPLIAPAFTINLVLGIIGSLKVFDIIFIMTNGGPAYATQTILIDVYQQAFTLFNFGYASATGLFSFLLILVISVIALVLLRRREVIA
ncbi:carbohydrate ABC transporter permease [Tengunoibacter tsumagoiensis]|uniref:ABC transmembrane type-1 domain-containing protein n=1 Tax=Tengunoibacter tsumagoiensis TaxID=2014871 RepID=A0A402A752_9CHLR|nr:sugar ABC transporter permease [Tengunoibacter tsumagoiensis]GCE14970.1 hypothetical protein KTT_48290 [Tengunoibacter tsumagoiensis]